MPTWPTSNKPAETTTDADTKSISGARADIHKAIENVNTITDFFNLGTPGSGDDNKVLTYDHSTGYIVLETSTGGSQSPLVADLDQDGFMIKDTSRDYQILGNQSNTTTLSNVFDAMANLNRVHGVVNVNYQDGYPSNRIHTNPTLTYIKADADASNGSSSPGRIRANYFDTQYDLASYDNTTTGFGKGYNANFFSGVAKNTASSTTSNLTKSTAVVIAPQIDTGNTENVIITDMAGLEVQGYLAGSGSSATNFYGFYYNTPSGANSANLGTSNKYSFYGADTGATLYNAGPLQADGLSYPTSDGSSGQVIKTDGSGNLSFTNLTTTDIYSNEGTLASDGATTTPNYNDGNFLRYELTRDGGVGGGVKLNAPSNMSDGNVMYLAFEATAGTAGQSAIVAWNTGQNIYASSSSNTIASGKTLLLRVTKIAGPKYLVNNDNLYDASPI